MKHECKFIDGLWLGLRVVNIEIRQKGESKTTLRFNINLFSSIVASESAKFSPWLMGLG